MLLHHLIHEQIQMGYHNIIWVSTVLARSGGDVEDNTIRNDILHIDNID